MRKIWTDRERQFLRRHYPDTPNKKLAARLGRTESSVFDQANILGLHKTKEYLQSNCRLQQGDRIGIATQFKPGHRPHNKGKKGWCVGGNSVKTQFKKGNRPHTWVPVGSERVTKDGILQRKVSDTGYGPRDWKSAHSLLWEQHHGPIPKGHLVVFRNGNRGDIRIENLELITRAENMRRNTIHNLPEPLADVCRIRGVLNRRINERTGRNEK